MRRTPGLSTEPMRDSRTHLISVWLFLIATAFGCLALLVHLASLHLQVPGTNTVIDPGEIFVLIGAALTGPVGGAVIGLLSGLGDPDAGSRLFVVVSTMLGAVWVGWAYKGLVHDRFPMPLMLLAWVGVVFGYSVVCAIPVIAVAKDFLPEFIPTAILTSAVLLVLPRAARSPMWWTARHPRVVASLHERPARNIVALRLMLWFLLLSSGPLVVMGVFLQSTLTQLSMEKITGEELTVMLNVFERVTLVRLGVALALVSGIAGVVIWLIIGRPIRSLAQTARRVGRNDLQARVNPEMMSDEVAILGEAFNEMTESLGMLHKGLQTEIEDRRSTEQALRRSERRFREMSDLLPQTVYEVDMTGRFLFANRAASTMFGFEADGPPEGRSFLEYVAPEDRERARNTIAQMYEGSGSTSGEYMFIRADGSTFPGLISATVVRDGDRPSGMRGIVVDISEQRHVQEVLQNSVTEKELMVKEIHHRVKNNLQIISSLLNLQTSFIRDPVDLALFGESVDRIRSMALIHDRLYKSRDLAGIEFREYIEALVMSLFHLYGQPNVTFAADVQDVRLSIDMAIPCGLIINELVTNALKHAFPDRRRGTITVSLATRTNGDVELCVADDGVGMPGAFDIAATATLGLQLVTILTNQLTGTLEILKGQGTTFRIIVPPPPASRQHADAPDPPTTQERKPV